MKKMLVVFLIIFAAGCAKKYVKAPEEAVKPEEDVRVEEVEKMEEVEEVKPLISPREAEEIESSEIRDTLFEFQDALFDYDKYDIRPDAREALDSVASWLSSHKEINILIEGHCDERGTNEYNLALGERRAKAARDYLISSGVAHVRMNIVTYGEERQVCTDQTEECWQKNRRAHFVVMK
jgi:peptidoglycan-associated lipoprotein